MPVIISDLSVRSLNASFHAPLRKQYYSVLIRLFLMLGNVSILKWPVVLG